MRVLALLLSSLLVTACTNMVRSEAAWFGPGDAAGAPRLRDGVWTAIDPGCGFDANRPLEQWPTCARGRVIRGGEELNLTAFHGADGQGRHARSGYDWSSEAFVLAAGAPRIHQRACGEPPSTKPEEAAADPAESSAIDEAVSRLVYCYAGVRSDAFDADGRIVAFTTWPIWCGPMTGGAEGEGGPNVTRSPFDGLTVVGEHCVADDIAALRAAAVASETLSVAGELPDPPLVARFRWVRDGWR